MNITTCLPISKQHGLETLTYFSATNYEPGSIISVPIRARSYPAIVLEQKPLERSKAEIKNLTFNLKQLPKTKVLAQLPSQFIAATFKIADHYAAEASTIMHHILQNFEIINYQSDILPSSKPTETIIWQAKYLDFYREINKLIRNKKNKVTIIVSDKNELEFFSNLLEQFKPLVLRSTSSKTKKQKLANASLVITTRGLGPLACLTHNTIITINPGGDSWRDKRRPYFLWDELIAEIASGLGRKIIHYSTAATQTDWQNFIDSKKKQNHFINNEYQPNPNISLIERSGGHKNDLDTVLDRRVQHLITNNLKEGKKTMLYVTRRGLFPVLACNDCKATTYTKAFMEQVQRYAISKASSDWVDPETAEEWTDRCPQCGSWRLYPVALSLGQTIKALKHLVDKDQIFSVDTVQQKSSESKAQIKAFEQNESGVLITTQRGIYHLNNPVDDVVIVSIDAALSSNSVSIETQMLRLLYHLESAGTGKIILQTRLENNHILRTFTSGKIRAWQKDSLSQRKILGFPPFKVQIKVALPPRFKVDDVTAAINRFSDRDCVNVSVLPSLTPGTTILLTADSNYWNDSSSQNLKEVLKSISLENKVLVNPDILM